MPRYKITKTNLAMIFPNQNFDEGIYVQVKRDYFLQVTNGNYLEPDASNLEELVEQGLVTPVIVSEPINLLQIIKEMKIEVE